jgi:pimeloyl-[acyl-carrier protein] methyl ester esterase
MSLHVQQTGAGPDVVLLHGWGLHSEVFADLARQLATAYRITLIDLPGHGRSPATHQAQNPVSLAEAVVAVAPPHATWLGWSLGGMIATQVALNAPTRVEKLILVASSPRFVTGDAWPCAMDPAVLAGFAQALREDYRGTLERFLALQVAPGTEGRETLRQLREMLLRFPAPATQALNDGLAILRTADLRAQYPALHCPNLSIFGERDRLVPAGAGLAVKALLPTAQVDIIKGAGHAPFISHPHVFLDLVAAFLEQTHD